MKGTGGIKISRQAGRQAGRQVGRQVGKCERCFVQRTRGRMYARGTTKTNTHTHTDRERDRHAHTYTDKTADIHPETTTIPSSHTTYVQNVRTWCC